MSETPMAVVRGGPFSRDTRTDPPAKQLLLHPGAERATETFIEYLPLKEQSRNGSSPVS